ncbi:MAG: hypothetical protein ACK5QT_02845 [Oligoflexia bacterium]|jgi:hypothetical protein
MANSMENHVWSEQWRGFLAEGAVVMARRVETPEPEPEPESSAVATAQPTLRTNPVKLLIFLESEPDLRGRDLLTRMMSAIQLAATDYVLEWGDFPRAQSAFVVGVGLGQRKFGRLSALRPDWIELPSLAEIAGDPARKRQAWEKLQQLQVQLRVSP